MTIDRYADMASIRDEWTPLALASGNVFATWEWNDAWWREFGTREGPIILALRAPVGRIRGIIPVYRRIVPPLRIARLLGHGPADQGALVHDSSDGGCAVDLIRAAAELPGLDLLVAEQLGATDRLTALEGARVLSRQSAPVIRLTRPSWNAYLQSLEGSTRATIRRKQRRIARRRNVNVRLTQDGAKLERDLDVLFSLHAMRWPGSNFVRLQRFHREFAATALKNGWLRLWILEVDGTAAAAWYGFRFAQIEHYYQSGWDPDFAYESVGHVLLAHTIEAALEDGVVEYRFGRGDEAYKFRYANEQSALVTMALPRTRLGAGAVKAAPLLQRFSRLRRLRHSLLDPR